MKYLIPICLLLVISCTSNSKEESEVIRTKENTYAFDERTPKVTGLGGIFFQSQDPSVLTEWYGENLGLAIDPYGSPFEFRNANNPDEINYLRWSVFKKDPKNFEPSKKEFMINYRVQNLKEMVDHLKANGVIVLDDIVTYDYGKFVHILDPDSNKIELWEPVDSVLTKLGGPTTK